MTLCLCHKLFSTATLKGSSLLFSDVCEDDSSVPDDMAVDTKLGEYLHTTVYMEERERGGIGKYSYIGTPCRSL